MTVRYVGPGGNDANSGLSWALRKLTLNGVEDTPVAAGDTVYVGPGTYRETLTVDVSGTAGNVISYIGDYSGANTDGVGGVVRITGSDNDRTATRTNCIASTGKSYRTFRGFLLEMTTNICVSASDPVGWIVEQCCLGLWLLSGATGWITFTGSGQATCTVRNCMFGPHFGSICIDFSHSSTVSNTGHVVENCFFLGYSTNVRSIRVGGIAVKNCSSVGGATYFVTTTAALAAGQTITCTNNIIIAALRAFYAVNLGEITEDYNSISSVSAPLTNVSAGAHSNAYPPLFDSRWFFETVNGGRILTPFDLASYSQLVNLAGTSPTTTDMRGTSVQGAQREWGALEYDSTLLIKSAGGDGAVSISPYRGNL